MAERAPVYEPAAARSALGIISTPIGTLDEIRAQGMDPEQVSCCHPRSPGVRGCPMWDSCRFGEPRRGAFKGQGPHYIGYYLKTSRSDGGRQVENLSACYNYVRVLQHREIYGHSMKAQRKDHELIRIIAQEGETIYVRRWERNAPDGGNKSNDITMRSWVEPMEVPHFPRPSESPAFTYEQQLSERERRRERAEEEDDMERFERVRSEMREGTTEATEADEQVLDMTETPPVAAVVSPKARNKA